jgi:hypothetical protein
MNIYIAVLIWLALVCFIIALNIGKRRLRKERDASMTLEQIQQKMLDDDIWAQRYGF